MEKLIHEFYEDYYSSIDFKKWQDNLSNEIYSSLKSNVTSGEVEMVTDLCDVMSSQKYKGLHIESKKIHGKTSEVEFNYANEKVVKELADMVIVSIVTSRGKIKLLKTAFIQNKKGTSNKKSSCSWKIDQEQLFLLKNFPKFTGVSGIFKDEEIIFLNHSSTLGNYGLFTPTGDMAFLTSRNTFCNQSGGTITFDKIKNASLLCNSLGNNDGSFSFFYKDFYHYIDFAYKNRFMFVNKLHNLPFFNNYNYALDVYEIVKELTYFNIGEPSFASGQVINDTLYCYTKKLLYSAFGYNVDGDDNFKYNQDNNDISYENGTNVIFNRLELDERED
jgi:hypothetical protein